MNCETCEILGRGPARIDVGDGIKVSERHGDLPEREVHYSVYLDAASIEDTGLFPGDRDAVKLKPVRHELVAMLLGDAALQRLNLLVDEFDDLA